VRRTRTFSWSNPILEARQAAALSGLEHLGAIAAAELSLGPLATLLGFELLEVQPGQVLVAAEPEELHYNHTGFVHGGFVCSLLDQATGMAAHSTLLHDEAFATAHLSVNLVRRLTVDSGRVRCQGNVLHRGRTTLTVAGRVADADGRLHAHATATCLVLPNA
jgi:uncharacterized protein (TIGR00369 family)